MFVLIAVEYFLLDPSDEVPERHLSELRAMISCGIIAQASLELEWCFQQQSISRVRPVLERLVVVVAAEIREQAWCLKESTEISEAVRRFSKELAFAFWVCNILTPVASSTHPLAIYLPYALIMKHVTQLIIHRPNKRFRKFVTTLGVRFTDGQSLETTEYLSLLENMVNVLTQAEREFSIWTRRFILL